MSEKTSRGGVEEEYTGKCDYRGEYVQEVNRQSTGSQQAVNRQSTGSQQVVNWQSTGSQQAVNRQLADVMTHLVLCVTSAVLPST